MRYSFFSFFSQFTHWFFQNLARETDTLKEARHWHVGTVRRSCLFCQKLIDGESAFCSFCGCAQSVSIQDDKQTTGHNLQQIKLVRLIPPVVATSPQKSFPVMTLTKQMQAFQRPGDRRFETYRRMLKENQEKGWS